MRVFFPSPFHMSVGQRERGKKALVAVHVEVDENNTAGHVSYAGLWCLCRVVVSFSFFSPA